MLTVAYSRFSSPSAHRIAEQGEVTLVRNPTEQVDVNWGCAKVDALLNSDTSNATNKRVMREKFAAAGVPMPRLLSVSDVQGEIMAERACLGRPDRHTKGRGMWMVRETPDIARSLTGAGRKRAATHFMEWVEAEREYRVHIFQGRSIRISRKDYGEDKKWIAVPAGDLPLAAVRQAGKAAVVALGLDFGAVDVLARGEANEEVWVLEVNSAPGLGGTMPKVYFDTFMNWKEER